MDQPSDNAVVDLRMSSSDEDGDDDDSSVGGDEDDFVEVTVQDIKAPAITRANKVNSNLIQIQCEYQHTSSRVD